MSFNLYLAGGYSQKLEFDILDMGANRLYSQLTERKLGQQWIDYSKEVSKRKIIVDSGAYSVHTRGETVDVDEYIEYLNERQGSFVGIAQVDKIPGVFNQPRTLKELQEAPEETWENYMYMRERLIDKDCLMALFHQGEDFSHLQRILDFRDSDGSKISYIGISPANDVAYKYREEWLSSVFKAIKSSSNPDVRTHAFGMTSLNVLERFPFHSADSTSWIHRTATGAMFSPWGNIIVSDWQTDNPYHVSHLDDKKLKVLQEQTEKFGVTLEEISSQYLKRAYYNVRYLLDWAENYRYKGNNYFQKRLF